MCSIAMCCKKIKLDEESIGDILVADTDSESDSEASDFEEFSEAEEKKQQASTKVGLQAATNGEIPTGGPPQGRNTNIHPFIGPEIGFKESEAPHINKDSSPLSVFVLFSQKVFICWLNSPTCTTSNT